LRVERRMSPVSSPWPLLEARIIGFTSTSLRCVLALVIHTRRVLGSLGSGSPWVPGRCSLALGAFYSPLCGAALPRRLQRTPVRTRRCFKVKARSAFVTLPFVALSRPARHLSVAVHLLWLLRFPVASSPGANGLAPSPVGRGSWGAVGHPATIMGVWA